jgi:hypothetical protein
MIRQYFEESINIKKQFIEENEGKLEKIIELIKNAFQN